MLGGLPSLSRKSQVIKANEEKELLKYKKKIW